MIFEKEKNEIHNVNCISIRCRGVIGAKRDWEDWDIHSHTPRKEKCFEKTWEFFDLGVYILMSRMHG